MASCWHLGDVVTDSSLEQTAGSTELLQSPSGLPGRPLWVAMLFSTALPQQLMQQVSRSSSWKGRAGHIPEFCATMFKAGNLDR